MDSTPSRDDRRKDEMTMETDAKTIRSPFKHVLLATDFAVSLEGSFKAALRLCEMNEASLWILHVLKGDAVTEAETGLSPETGLFDSEALRLLKQLSLRAREAGIDCKSSIETGVASEKILKAIDSDQIDLVILGTSEPRGSKRLVFGPTAEAVMRKAPCPIMTIGPVAADVMKKNSARGPIVFATDFHALTRKAIRLAVLYSKSTALQLHCLHVLPRTLQVTDGDQTLSAILTSALRHLAATCEIEADLPVCCVRFGSEISNAIVDYAREQQASMIILGVRRSSMVTGDEPLPIAFRIITEAPCPVVTIVCESEAESISLSPAKSEASHFRLQ